MGYYKNKSINSTNCSGTRGTTTLCGGCTNSIRYRMPSMRPNLDERIPKKRSKSMRKTKSNGKKNSNSTRNSNYGTSDHSSRNYGGSKNHKHSAITSRVVKRRMYHPRCLVVMVPIVR